MKEQVSESTSQMSIESIGRVDEVVNVESLDLFPEPRIRAAAPSTSRGIGVAEIYYEMLASQGLEGTRKMISEGEHYHDYLRQLTYHLWTNEGRNRLLRGLLAMTKLTEDPLLSHAYVFCQEEFRLQGIEDLQPSFEWSFNDKPPLVDVWDGFNIEGCLGLKHGHYKSLTFGSLVGLCMASERVDFLLVGIDSNERTLRYKRPPIVFSDEQRLKLLGSVADGVFLIEDQIEYGGDGYGRLLEIVKPHVYFGNSRNPEWLRKQMAQISRKVGCFYEEDYVPSFSTSEYLENSGGNLRNSPFSWQPNLFSTRGLNKQK